jgi:hypothetical protein
LCFYLQRGTSERSSTSLRLFLPICLMYYYSLQIKNGIKKIYNVETDSIEVVGFSKYHVRSNTVS